MEEREKNYLDFAEKSLNASDSRNLLSLGNVPDTYLYDNSTSTVFIENTESITDIKILRKRRNLKEHSNHNKNAKKEEKVLLKNRQSGPGVNGPNILFIMADDLGETAKI